MALSWLLAAVTLLGFFGKRNWFCYLLSIGRFQLAVVEAVFFLTLVIFNPAWSIIPLVAVIINVLLSRNTHIDKVSKNTESKLRVAFANLFVANLNYDRIAESLKDSRADVVIVAEIMEDTFQELCQRLPDYTTTYFDASPRNLGIAAFVKNRSAAFHSEHFSNPKAATLVSEVKVGDKELRILGYHTDAPLTPKKYRALKEEISGLAEFSKKESKPLLVIGDFNDTTQTALFQPLFDAGLKDFRKPFERGVTWPLFFPKFLRFTFDNALVKNGAHVAKREYGKRTGSDHIPIIVDIALD
jgi:endonuclease/exonuclease/phosphatase (EEP) superfamily protein YafD